MGTDTMSIPHKPQQPPSNWRKPRKPYDGRKDHKPILPPEQPKVERRPPRKPYDGRKDHKPLGIHTMRGEEE